jgi:nitrogen fixation protein
MQNDGSEDVLLCRNGWFVALPTFPITTFIGRRNQNGTLPIVRFTDENIMGGTGQL